MNYMIKTEIRAAREQFFLECISVLAKYRGEVSAGAVQGQFVLPQTLNNYPLFVYSALRSAPFASWEDYAADAKVAMMLQMSGCSVSTFLMKIYTRTYSLSEIKNSPDKWGGATDHFSIVKPVSIPSTHQELVTSDGYIFCTAEFIYMFLPSNIERELLIEVILFQLHQYSLPEMTKPPSTLCHSYPPT